MTARIVTQTNREPITLREFAQMPWLSDGDADAFEQNHLRPGQLWQRVAEGKPGRCVKLRNPIERVGSPAEITFGIRTSAKHGEGLASGIIRAGVRIK